jgi:Tfp pilus assembly protein PilP
MRQTLITNLAYIMVGGFSILLAVFIAVRFVKPSQSDDSKQVRMVAQNASSTAPVDPNMAAGPTAVAASEPPPALPLDSDPEEGVASAAGAPVDDQVDEGAAVAVPTDSVSFLEPYIFDVREGRRNPFKPPLLDDGSLPDVIMPGTPLERYDLDELKLVGIMWDIAMPKAMVIDPQGEVHVLGKEDRIGRKRGYIAVIRESEVVVVEASDFDGENTYATRILRIDK